MDTLAAAMELSPDETITEALYAAARYLRDTSKGLEGLVTESKKAAESAVHS